MKKVVGKSYASNYQIDASPRSIILLLNEEVEARDIPGFICTLGGNCRSKGRFFTAADSVVHMKIARLNRKMRSSNLQQNNTKTGNIRISLQLPQSSIRMQKPLPKETRWSKTMLLRDSQPCRSVVLRQRRETEANWRVIICLLAMKPWNYKTKRNNM